MEIRSYCRLFAVLLPILLTCAIRSSTADVISNGVLSAGVHSNGHLVDSGVGLSTGGFDALIGVLGGADYEAWGLWNGTMGMGSVSGHSSSFSFFHFPSLSIVPTSSASLSPVSFMVNPAMTEAISVVDILSDPMDPMSAFYRVSHDYFFDHTASLMTSQLLALNVTVQNVSGAPIGPSVYRRVIDWDYADVTGFALEHVRVVNDGGPGSMVIPPVISSSAPADLFEHPDPAVPFAGATCDTDMDMIPDAPCGPGTMFDSTLSTPFGADYITAFDFEIAALDAGASYTFGVFFGFNDTVAGLEALLTGAGVGRITYADVREQSPIDGPRPVFGVGFGEPIGHLGGPTPIPEPATLTLMATGLAGLLAIDRRRRKKIA